MTSTAEWLFPVVRGLITMTLLLLVGIQVSDRIAARRLTGRDPSIDASIAGWSARLPGLLAWFLLMLSITRGALQVLSFVDPGEQVTTDLIRGMLWQGTWGDAWVLQSSAALALLATSWLLRSNVPLRRGASLLLVTAVLWAQTGMGHPADEIWGSLPGRLVDFTHLIGGGLWLGTLAALALTVFPTLWSEDRIALLAGVVRDFSIPARLGALLLLLSGALTTWTYTGSLAVIPTTVWGQLLLVKLACLAGVVALGWWNWRVVTPALEGAHAVAPARLRRAVTIELLLGFAMLVITAYLVAAPLPIHAG